MGRNNKVFRIIVVVFLILFSLLEVVAIIRYLDNFINGFTPSDIVGNVTGDTLYGFQAIKQDGWAHLITFPIIHLASAIQVLYGGMCTWKNEKKRIWWVVISELLLVLNIALWIFFW